MQIVPNYLKMKLEDCPEQMILHDLITDNWPKIMFERAVSLITLRPIRQSWNSAWDGVLWGHLLKKALNLAAVRSRRDKGENGV